MKICKFAFEDYPAIVAIHNSQNIVWPEWPSTPEAWKEADRNRSPKSIFERWWLSKQVTWLDFPLTSKIPGAFLRRAFPSILKFIQDINVLELALCCMTR